MADTEGVFLPMWPDGASDDYIRARMDLAAAERRLRDEIENVAAARRALPPGAVIEDYILTEGDPQRQTRISQLFGDHDTLVIYHLMFHPDADAACPMCSMWVDGFHGVSHHLAQHAGFAVVAKAPQAKLLDWAAKRGWDGLRLLSSHGTTFNADLRAEHPNGDQRPMISVFTRDPGTTAIRHVHSLPANFVDGSQRAIDLLSPVWNVLDLLPGGRGEWYAENGYAGRDRG
ncbi:DUF899 family protein [Winogradskya humida]|uniref:Dithiol-disulfide oxidoreductase (DUF899 family) n=1 Tax=Winogradskya humida TaxID=113566 RepID=A0ABQ4A171_9ACTN|nr:DUF899 family protein [Actinoplanes humidus]GIE24582.1 hypothetical protein Ahu01nite_076840 [Actinoplanes humidus]